MKPPVSSINTIDISQVNALAGRKMPANDFFVYSKDEIPFQEEFFHPTRSPFFLVTVHTGGQLNSKCNLINYKLTKNCLLIIPTGIVYELVKEVENCSFIGAGFTPGFLESSMAHKKYADTFNFLSLQSDPYFLLTDEETETICTLMLSLKKYYAKNEHPFKKEMMHHSFNLFMFELAAIVKKYRGNEDAKLTRKEHLVFSFLKLLGTHFREERSVQFYADALYITPQHLTKTAKEITTKTCGELIDEMVIVEAKILLSDLSYSVAQVADQLNFSDQFFFSKFFKRHTGLSPKDYKSSFSHIL
jgi:AraC family transcriptional regulator, transcriptional activator of pobA